MNTKLNTILFDLDGTLIDTNELIISSFLHTLEKYFPGQYKRADVIPFMGPTLEETFEGINKDLAEDLAKTYREFNISNHDLFVKEFNGVYETVRVLKENGFKLGIVTTKRMDVALKGIKLTKLDEFFDCLVAIDHVKKPKPDPEPILLALEQLQSVPEETLMVGDNHHDILAGKNAGTKTAGVAWSLKGKDYLARFEPDYMLDNMADLLSILGV
ncbi:pyrophosphatase PpaX [Bacillus methanolicus]|uniref:pyrophosphatase PpaX n=1 Tax=Bacillus methanolicus TaxID=1471 RepID=UPI0023806BCD|nr:pyrophosphatase PpaX [Bacillus methanolicus]MDE3840102.1 pyrophosphatase PpaX [Bacillus methanolicus]